MEITISLNPSDEKQVAEAIVFLSQFTKAAPAEKAPVERKPKAPSTGFIAEKIAAHTKAKRGRPAKDAAAPAARERASVLGTPDLPMAEEAAAATSTTPPAPEAVAPTSRPNPFADMKDDLPFSAEKAPVPPVADVQAAIEKLVAGRGLQFTRDLLARYGVQRGRDLAETQRAEFIKEAIETTGPAQ